MYVGECVCVCVCVREREREERGERVFVCIGGVSGKQEQNRRSLFCCLHCLSFIRGYGCTP